MIKYFGKAFKITNENIILTTPLVLFLLLFSIYLGVMRNVPENLTFFSLLLITTLFMVSAFFAGWFFMVQKAIELDKKEIIADEDKAKMSFNLIKEVPIGIGEYFLSFVGVLILYCGLILLFSFIGYQIGIHFIGKVDLSIVDLKTALNSTAQMKAFVSSLSAEELIKLNAWNFLILILMTTFSFITMFWAVKIISGVKNPFIAFFQSLSFLFRNFFSSIILFIYISIINFLVSLMNAFSAVNPILYFVSTLAYFYFVVYVVVLVFLYYDSENNKTIKDNCSQSDSNIGTDSSGEEQSCDTAS